MKRALTISGIVILVAGLLAIYYVFRTPSEVKEQSADFTLSASELVAAFADEEKANQIYVGKIVVVTGEVANLEKNGDDVSVILASGDPLSNVTCSFVKTAIESTTQLSIGTTVRIKGLCTGKLMDVVLTQCSIVE